MKNSGSITKAFVLVFAVVLFAGFISLPVHLNAASATQLTVSDASGKAGDEVTISISISPNSGLGAGELVLKYDTSKLTYLKYQLGPAANGGMSVVNPDYRPETGFKSIKYVYINATGLTAGGSVLDITFTIKSGWSGETPLVLTADEFKESSDNYKDITYNIKNGKITTGTTTPTQPDVTSTTKPDVGTTAKPTTTPTTTKPTTTRTEYVTKEDGSKVTQTDKAGSTVNKTTVVYDTVTRVENVTDKDGSKVTEKDKDGSTVYKTTVIHERVVGSEYVTQEDGSKVFVTDEAGSTVYQTTLIYETVDNEDVQNETDDTQDTDDGTTVGTISTAKKTVVIVALVLVLLVAAALIAVVYKKKKGTAE